MQGTFSAQLGQVLGLFLRPGGRPRPFLGSDTSVGSDLTTTSSGTESGVGSCVAGFAATGTSIDTGAGVVRTSLPSGVSGMLSRESPMVVS